MIIRNTAAISMCLLMLTVQGVRAESPSAKVDPCAVVTAADVQSAYGHAMAAKSSDDGLQRNCQYVSTDGRYYVYVSTSDLEKKYFERGHTANSDSVTLVPSLGVPAFIQSMTLLFWKNGTKVTVHVGDHSGSLSPGRQEEIQEKLAQAALKRL